MKSGYENLIKNQIKEGASVTILTEDDTIKYNINQKTITFDDVGISISDKRAYKHLGRVLTPALIETVFIPYTRIKKINFSENPSDQKQAEAKASLLSPL